MFGVCMENVVGFCVKSKVLSIRIRANSTNQDAAPHNCEINWDGDSGVWKLVSH